MKMTLREFKVLVAAIPEEHDRTLVDYVEFSNADAQDVHVHFSSAGAAIHECGCSSGSGTIKEYP